MKEFFEGVGEGHNAGVWESAPKAPPKKQELQLKKPSIKMPEEAIGC